jgi:hypothetical protein
MKIFKCVRRIISTTLIAAMLFFGPSFLSSSLIQAGACPVASLPIVDVAFAIPCAPIPPPIAAAHVPAWVWVGMACPASIILSGIVANFRDNRQLTTAEAWTCGLLYWIPMPPQQAPPHHH